MLRNIHEGGWSRWGGLPWADGAVGKPGTSRVIGILVVHPIHLAVLLTPSLDRHSPAPPFGPNTTQASTPGLTWDASAPSTFQSGIFPWTAVLPSTQGTFPPYPSWPHSLETSWKLVHLIDWTDDGWMGYFHGRIGGIWVDMVRGSLCWTLELLWSPWLRVCAGPSGPLILPGSTESCRKRLESPILSLEGRVEKWIPRSDQSLLLTRHFT